MWGLSAEQIATVIVGIATALTIILGGKKAKDQVRATPSRPELVEVAGALIDRKTAEELIDAFVDLKSSIDQNTNVLRETGRKLEETDRSVHALVIELARASRR